MSDILTKTMNVFSRQIEHECVLVFITYYTFDLMDFADLHLKLYCTRR